MVKLPGVPTGTFTAVIGGRLIKWKPQGDLTLIASQAAAEQGLEREIASNPDPDQAIATFRKAPHVHSSARLFVGFNVASVPTWRAGEVYLVTFLARETQLLNRKNAEAHPAFSFYVGLGAFPGVGAKVASEKSAQVVFLNYTQDADEFFKDIISLASILCQWLSQEAIIAELTEEGKVIYSEEIWPTKRAAAFKPITETRKYLNENAYRIDPEVYNLGRRASSGSGSDQDEPW